MKHGAVDGTSIVRKFTSDLLKEVSQALGHWFAEVKISHLLFLAVILWDVLRWCSIVPGGFLVLELEEGFFDATFHGELDCMLGVVPVEVDLTVVVAFPVRFHWVVIADGFLRCKASALLMYLTPKLLTTRVKEMGILL